MSDHPEHEKLAAIKDKSQTIGEFLEWLPTQGITLCTYYYGRKKGDDGGYCPAAASTTALLAKFFDIDLDKLESEKQQMLDSLREKP